MAKRIIPSLMFSQHPDNAQKPYWHKQAFVKTHHELKECFLMFKEMGADEVMWDWEGKLVDEAVIERLLTHNLDFFRRRPLGKKLFLTFRVPNPRIESGYRLGRAFMVILSAEHLAYSAGLPTPPLFEVILPMTETAEEMIQLQEKFQEISRLANRLLNQTDRLTGEEIEVIPIFESVRAILDSANILNKYLLLHQQKFGKKPVYLRPFCARSDPALNSGIVPTTVAIKWALSEYEKLSEKTKAAMYPIIAPGCLPFRGGLTPETGKKFITEFSGIKTLVVQSAFRYDYSLSSVKKIVKTLKAKIPLTKTKILPSKIFKEIKEIIPWFEAPYKKTVEKLAPIINKIADQIPRRRERAQHIGLFGYSRRVSGIKLPRAIGFTAACYSLGIPPEFIGTGFGLKKTLQERKIKILESLYLNLRFDLVRAGRFLRKESLDELGLKELKEEVKIIEDYLGEKLESKSRNEMAHQLLSKKIVSAYLLGKTAKRAIEEAAVLRRSLG